MWNVGACEMSGRRKDYARTTNNECERINDAEIEFTDTVEGEAWKGEMVLGLEVRVP